MVAAEAPSLDNPEAGVPGARITYARCPVSLGDSTSPVLVLPRWAGHRGRAIIARMQTETRTEVPARSSKLAGWALILGASAFGLFWGLAPTPINDAIDWVPSLAVHAVSIFGLAFGLVCLTLSVERPAWARNAARVGAGFSLVGLLTVFPMLAVGLALIGVALIAAGAPRLPSTLILVGGAAMAIVLIVLAIQHDGRLFGDEGAPDFGPVGDLTFQSSVLLVSVGLVALGVRLLRSGALIDETR